MITLGILLTLIFCLIALAFPDKKPDMWHAIKVTWIIILCIIMLLFILGIIAGLTLS